MSADFPAGWYPDYLRDDRLRYWDGAEWTSRTTLKVREEQGPPPPPPSAAAPRRGSFSFAVSAAAPGDASHATPASQMWARARRSLGHLWTAPRRWSRRRVIISAAVAAAVALVAATGITYLVVQRNATLTQEATEAKAAHAKAVADEEQRQKDIDEVTAKNARDNALSSASTQLESSETLYGSSTTWGDPAARQDLQTAIDAMKALLSAGDDATIDQLRSAYANLSTARAEVGTLEAAQDKQYKALVDQGANAGRFTASAAGRDYCAYLDKNYTTDNVFQLLWSSGTGVSEIDVAAIRIYCPKYETAMNIALSAVFDGTHVDGQNGFSAGPWHTAGGVASCYWELSDGHGNIFDNNFINSAPSGVSVNVEPGETFVTDGCNAWVKG